MSLNRCTEPGWLRIGRIDSPRRRSLWIRDTRGAEPAIELCAGREGDDAYVKITPDNPQWREIQHLLSCAKFAAEFEDPDGLTLAREAGEDVSDSIEVRVTTYSAVCPDCELLSELRAVRRSPDGREIRLLQAGVMHALDADGYDSAVDSDVPMCGKLP